MRKIAVTALLFLLALGNLSQPTGYMQSLNLWEMYAQCSGEDPDITPADFVFEHLLNLEDFMHFLEGEDDDAEKGERPHEPYHLAVTTIQFVASIPKPIVADIPFYKEFLTEKINYPLPGENFYHCHFCADIFHPPIV